MPSFMPELSMKLRIKINYYQLNAVIPNTHSNAFELKLDHYSKLFWNEQRLL